MLRNLAILTASLASFAFAAAVSAEPAIYEIPTSGVTCGGSAASAEAAVRRAGDVETVKADPATHTVVATFDTDTTSIDEIVNALDESGFEPGEPKLVN